MICSPTLATTRTDRPTRGAEVAALAAKLGTPFMDWQRLVADVAGEYDPATGRPVYREVIVTVPRQSGKTTLLLAHEVHRAIAWGEQQRIFYSAQTGWDARRKLIDDQAPMLQSSPLNAVVKRVLRGAGNEAIIFKNGSRVDVMASSSSSGHGRTMDMGVIDEAFDDTDDRREQAMIPAMATRPNAQLWVVSTAGTDQSVYLNRKVETGRAAAAAGETSGVAFFEWSADLDDEPDDEDVWWSTMPALGKTISVEAVRHARQTMSEGEFRRAYLNQPTVADDRVIPKDLWLANVNDVAAPDGRLVFGVDVAPNRDSAAIAVADEQSRVEVVEHRPGVGWVADRLVELAQTWGAPVAVDQRAAAATFMPDLEDAGVDVLAMGTDDVAAACGKFYDRTMDGLLAVRPHEGLNAAVAGAARRNVGDRWLWGRRTSSVDITPLVAVTLALGGAWRFEPDDGPPMLSFA